LLNVTGRTIQIFLFIYFAQQTWTVEQNNTKYMVWAGQQGSWYKHSQLPWDYNIRLQNLKNLKYNYTKTCTKALVQQKRYNVKKLKSGQHLHC